MTQPKRKRYYVRLLLGALVLAGIAWVLHSDFDAKLQYHDRSVTFWFTQLPLFMVTTQGLVISSQLSTSLGHAYGNKTVALNLLAMMRFFPSFMAKDSGGSRIAGDEFIGDYPRWVERSERRAEPIPARRIHDSRRDHAGQVLSQI